jgi:curved DNA-binding protein CbpA
MLTWYDVLGVSAGASPGQVRSAYQARACQLAPQMLAGAPAKVLKAADVAKAAVDEAWRVLGDPAARPLYDSQIGARGNGEGLDQPDSDPSGPGGEVYGRGTNADMVMAALVDLMTTHSAPARRVIVPDLRGLFASSCLRGR